MSNCIHMSSDVFSDHQRVSTPFTQKLTRSIKHKNDILAKRLAVP